MGTVASTNDEAVAWARQGAVHGAMVVADRQTHGRGRQGRRWESPPGNLYASCILRVKRRPEAMAGLTLAVAVAVSEALEGLGVASKIKWPNDLLLGGRKVGGVLTELHAQGQGAPFVVVGVGLNSAVAPPLPPDAGALAAASLAELPEGPPARDAVAEAVRERLLELIDEFDAAGFDAVRSRWEARWRDRGERVRARLPGGAMAEGVAVGVDEEGALLLDRGDGGPPLRVTTGDVERA